MTKKEFKVGEVFQCGLVKLKCVEGTSYCKGCFFDGICNVEIIGACANSGREDSKNVIFVKVEDEL